MKITNKFIHTFVLCNLAVFNYCSLAQAFIDPPELGRRVNPYFIGKDNQTSRNEFAIDQCRIILQRTKSNFLLTTAYLGIKPKENRSISKISRIWKGLMEFKAPYLISFLLLFVLLGLYVWWLNKSLQELKEKIKKNYALTKSSQDKLASDVSVVKNYSDNLSRQLEKILREMGKIEKEIIQLRSNQSTSHPSRQYGEEWDNPSDYNDYSYDPARASVFPRKVEISPSDTLSIIVENFNKGNESHFNNDLFFFLKPTSATNLGSQGVDINASAKVEFERASDNTAQASYIGFKLNDQNTYIVPNLFNKRWKQVITNDENKIFEWYDSSYVLAEPAMIENTGNDIWRLVKSGRFD
ncbi:hypothetical protein IQE94_11500 [Synechocystis sp. PCC 7339]|uniref:hypothetical protein n=1 Tax=unclassified Synechocystis TaxID=2640012 RepID=UPI001BAEB3D5|nr:MULTISPECIES: hypothetical protein [unclassified Synechocystis]QUS59574.1 hypothetical protein HTZ78_02000 [Synechocystis sp. PCC 7338]UAJ71760.1 hypothetical protein IQE94_11500 [Synechocystis sp. PCC 7339]